MSSLTISEVREFFKNNLHLLKRQYFTDEPNPHYVSGAADSSSESEQSGDEGGDPPSFNFKFLMENMALNYIKEINTNREQLIVVRMMDCGYDGFITITQNGMNIVKTSELNISDTQSVQWIAPPDLPAKISINNNEKNYIMVRKNANQVIFYHREQLEKSQKVNQMYFI